MRKPVDVINQFRDTLSTSGYEVHEMEGWYHIVDYYGDVVMVVTTDNKIRLSEDVFLQQFFNVAMDKDENKVFRPAPRMSVKTALQRSGNKVR